MNKIVKLNTVINILSGQILKRVAANNSIGEKTVMVKKVILPKAILSDGTIYLQDLFEQNFKVEVKDKYITKVNDIIIKLSTPYDSAIITEETAGCVVPSFCAIIRRSPDIDLFYLQAFLSSSTCKEELQKQVVGLPSTMLQLGKIGELLIPLPPLSKQREIGLEYKKSQDGIILVKRILELENKKNNITFKELFKNEN